MKLTVQKEYHGAPISKKLASNFIELGYGLQVEGMAAEMFFNRSFEPFYPYRLINKLWFDLLEDENDLGSRCETDWRVFDWYHSSYEHNAWFAFPGVAGYQPVGPCGGNDVVQDRMLGRCRSPHTKLSRSFRFPGKR